ncbi:hypothetical protein HAX54_003381, partial [Datura stramonium]|nr:hypothetical protein [Datura stramonium]
DRVALGWHTVRRKAAASWHIAMHDVAKRLAQGQARGTILSALQKERGALLPAWHGRRARHVQTAIKSQIPLQPGKGAKNLKSNP